MIGGVEAGRCIRTKDCNCGMPQKKKTENAASEFREERVSLHEEHIDVVGYGPAQQVRWKPDVEFTDLRGLVEKLLHRQCKNFEAEQGGKRGQG